MDTLYLTSHTPLPPSNVATIGFFDGVHLGHRHLLAQTQALAGQAGLRSLAITFECHPRQVLQSGYQPALLSTLDEKLRLLSRTGVDMTAVLSFDRAMAALSAREFMESVLRQRLNVSRLLIGYDHRFGRDRAEGFEQYVAYGRELGIEVVRSTPFLLDGQPVSSSQVRRLLEAGRTEEANRCLGHPYTLSGTVVSGYQEGRRLGFPTANLVPTADRQLVPAPGVYTVQVRTGEAEPLRQGIMNIGTRPTFQGTALSLEVHIIGFSGNLYDQQLQVAFRHRLREERRFDSPEALARQLALDKQTAIRQFQQDIEQ